MSAEITKKLRPTGVINLADSSLGAEAIHASDEFFAPIDRLLSPDEPVFRKGTYDDHGQWMDGWETRRRRNDGFDHGIVKLARPGVIRFIDLDTRFFTGNFAPHCSIQVTGHADPLDPDTEWTSILPICSLAGNDHNLFRIDNDATWQYLRLKLFPDGGIARLRVYCEIQKDGSSIEAGNILDRRALESACRADEQNDQIDSNGEPQTDWSAIGADEIIDLFAHENGGRALECNDQCFGDIARLNQPGRGANMGDGWETRRRREPGFDWTIVKLGHAGIIKSVEIDTAHFRGNHPKNISLNAARVDEPGSASLAASSVHWADLLPPQPLGPDAQHTFKEELLDVGPVTHVRINLHPDGGISRVRLYGVLARS